MAGQYLGAFVGSAVVFGVYRDLIDQVGKGELKVIGEGATAGIWATYPYNGEISAGALLGDQVSQFRWRNGGVVSYSQF